MKWEILFLQEAVEDVKRLDNSSRIQVLKAIDKVSNNPLPQSEGGYGKPLGNKQGNNLTGLLKIKLKKLGIRVVYKIEKSSTNMTVVIVSARNDNEVYKTAERRMQ